MDHGVNSHRNQITSEFYYVGFNNGNIVDAEQESNKKQQQQRVNLQVKKRKREKRSRKTNCNLIEFSQCIFDCIFTQSTEIGI